MFLIIFLSLLKGVDVYAANVSPGTSIHDFPIVSENSLQDIEDLGDEEILDTDKVNTEESGELLHLVLELINGQAMLMNTVVKLLFVSTVLLACIFGALIVLIIIQKFY